MKIRSNHAGFTLIEMAVVLAIIGLLAGGILGTQTFIRNARLTTMANDAKYYRDALNRFEAQYLAPPGDMSNATSYWSGVGNGNGDGMIGNGNTEEMFYSFHHLASAGLIDGSYTGVAGPNGASDADAGVNVPEGPISNTAYHFQDFGSGSVSGNGTYFDGFYARPLFAGRETLTGFPLNPMLQPKEAQQIDEKYDDGRPGVGTIRTPHSGSLANCASSTVATSATYVTST